MSKYKKKVESKILNDDLISENNSKCNVDRYDKYSTIAGIVICLIIVILLLPLFMPSDKVSTIKNYKLKETQECFNTILNKDLNETETECLLEQYKNICKEPDKEIYISQLISQVKNDYGLEDVNINLEIGERKTNSKGYTEYGHATYCGDIYIALASNSKYISEEDRQSSFNTVFHEMKHIKQYSEAYRTDPNLLAKAMCVRSTGNASQYCVKYYRQKLDKTYGSLDPYPKNSEEYQNGLEYINNFSTYKSVESGSSYSDYRYQKVEDEAFLNGSYSDTIFKYIKSSIKNGIKALKLCFNIK